MRLSCIVCGLLVLVAIVSSSPIEKRQAEDLSPLNEVYVVETEDDKAVDDERGDRDKRKIGIVKLGVTNGIINFVFGKLDSFLDSKTRALTALDEANKVKNAAFGIDNTQSATGQFLSNLVASKIQAASGSIGPVVNSASTLFQGAKNGLTGAVISKLAPLSSIAGGLAGGLSSGTNAGAGTGAGTTGSGGGGANLLGGLLASSAGALSSLSQSSQGLSGGSPSGAGTGPSASAGINLGAFGNLGGGGTISSTTEDIPEFDRTRVSLDIPSQAFGTGFTVITNISKILSNIILNSARRTQTVLEVFKPVFRGVFAIKGLPSDNPQ